MALWAGFRAFLRRGVVRAVRLPPWPDRPRHRRTSRRRGDDRARAMLVGTVDTVRAAGGQHEAATGRLVVLLHLQRAGAASGADEVDRGVLDEGAAALPLVLLVPCAPAGTAVGMSGMETSTKTARAALRGAEGRSAARAASASAASRRWSMSTCRRPTRGRRIRRPPTRPTRTRSSTSTSLRGCSRAQGCPVVWTYVAYLDSGEDCGVWGTRSNTPDSLQNIKVGSRRAELDDRCDIDRAARHHHQQAHGLGLLRDEPRLAAHLPQGRYGDRHGRLDLGLRARNGGRQPVARLSAPSSRRNASPTSTRARISPISTTWR